MEEKQVGVIKKTKGLIIRDQRLKGKLFTITKNG